MATVSFYLKKPEPVTGKALIYLQFKYNGQKLVYSFGQAIDPGKSYMEDGKQRFKNWDHAKQRVKEKKATTADGDYLINDLLDNLEAVCKKAYKEELKNGIPSPATLKQHLINFINQNKGIEKKEGPTLFELIEKFVGGEVLTSKNNRPSKGSLQNYRTVKLHLKNFEAKHRYRINFDSINLDFFNKYVSYLRNELKLKTNSIAKDISIIKLFMREAVDRDLTDNNQFRKRKFRFAEEKTDAVYLTEREIMKLYEHDFSFNKKLENTRDLFVFGCFVGLRYSDYSTVTTENIITIEEEKFIKMVTKKTQEEVYIPFHPLISEIINKYQDTPNKLPRTYSGQKFNEYIKEVCRIAKLTEKGRLSSIPEKELCDCISSHTARRSFATNYYLQGFPTIDLMKITGHKTEKAFLTYIKVTKMEAAKRLGEHIRKNWVPGKLRVA